MTNHPAPTAPSADEVSDTSNAVTAPTTDILSWIPADTINRVVMPFLDFRNRRPIMATCRALRDDLDPFAHSHLAVIPADTINRWVMPYLDLRDGLRIMIACRSLRHSLDPYANAFVYPYGTKKEHFYFDRYGVVPDVMPTELELPRRFFPNSKIEESLPDYMLNKKRGDDGIFEFNYGRQILKQHEFLRKKAETCGDNNDMDTLRSILKNGTICKILDSELYKVLEGFILKENTAGITSFLESGRAKAEALEYAIRKGRSAASGLLSLNAALMEESRRCDSCESGVGAFQCCQRFRCVSRKEKNVDKNSKSNVCEDCAKSGGFCDICRRYECERCGEETWERDIDEEEEYDPWDHISPKVTFRRCQECDRQACTSEICNSCFVSCHLCRRVACRICSKENEGWMHCSKCEDIPVESHMSSDYYEASLCPGCTGKHCECGHDISAFKPY